jgi:mannose-6-phosphate isomerase-like protein (cupin superfamily)
MDTPIKDVKKTQPGFAIVVQPDEGQSWWQPVPANGYTEVRVSKRNDPRVTRFSHGIQVVAPGCYVRDHSHESNEEILFFFEGEGKVVIDGAEEHPVRTGTTVFVGPHRRHTFINTGDKPLKFAWVLMPGGLEDFFEGIGRKRTPGEPAPTPFARPDNVLEIERQTVFAPPPEKPVNV